jgi:hypothetical protein
LTPTPSTRAAAARQPRLEVRRGPRLRAEEREQLERAGLWGLAPVESWSATGSSRDNGYATHGLFRFFGKFPPPLAAHLIAAHTRPGERVCDPMCGSGTTGVECLLAGRRCSLGDVNPLSLLLARVKTRRLGRRSTLAALERIRNRYAARRGGPGPVGLRRPEHWFTPAGLRSLGGLRAAVEAERPGAVRELFRAALAASVRTVSRATTQQGRLFLDAASARDEAWPTFERRARRAIEAVAALPAGAAPVRVAARDLRQPPAARDRGRAALVIAHPPYFNAYRYSRINALELAWLGIEPAAVRPAEVREFFKVGKPEKLAFYLEDMAQALEQAARLLRPGGLLAVMIGDAVLRGEQLPVVRPLLQRLGPGLHLERLALRRPRHAEASWVASQRRGAGRLGVALCEYVLLLRREA